MTPESHSNPTQPAVARNIYHNPSPHTTQSSDRYGEITTTEESLGSSQQSNSSGVSTTYKPLWLRSWVLSSFLVAFLVKCAALIFLQLWSSTHHGFAFSITKNQHAWKYGPTAILVFLVTGWRWVDYYCKATMPWQLMAQGYTSAERSMLLDYLWPMQIKSLQHAVKDGDTPVIASIAGFILLNLTVFASTDLLVLLPVCIPVLVTLEQTSKFDGSQFWKTVFQYDYDADRLIHHGFTLSNSSQLGGYSNITDSAASAYLGFLSANIHTGLGNVTLNNTIPSLRLGSDQDDVDSYTAHVQVFSPKASCEPANLSFSQVPSLVAPRDSSQYTYQFALDTSDCSAGHWNWTKSRGETINQESLNIYFTPNCDGCVPKELRFEHQRINYADMVRHCHLCL